MLTEYLRIRTTQAFVSDPSLYTKLREGARKAGIVHQSYGLGIEDQSTLHWLVHFDQGFLPKDFKWPEAEYGDFNEKILEISEQIPVPAFLPFENKPFPRESTDAAVTEVATFELKEGMHERFIEAIDRALEEVRKAKGARGAAWSVTNGESRKAYVFVGWDSVEDHTNFSRAEVVRKLQAELRVFVEKGDMNHVKFTDHT